MRSLLVGIACSFATYACTPPRRPAPPVPPPPPPAQYVPCAPPSAVEVERTLSLDDAAFDRFSIDGTRVRAIAGSDVIVLNATTGAVLSKVTLQPDATAASFDAHVQILQSGVDFFRLEGTKKTPLVTTQPVMGGARLLTDDGDLFVQGCEGVFDARTGKVVCPMEGCFAGGSDPEGRILHDRYLVITNSRGGFGFDVRTCGSAPAHTFTVTPVFDITPDGTVSLTTPHAFFPFEPDDAFALRDAHTDEIHVKLPLHAGDGEFAAALCPTGSLAAVLIGHALHFFRDDGTETLTAPLDTLDTDAEQIEFSPHGEALAIVAKGRKSLTFVQLKP